MSDLRGSCLQIGAAQNANYAAERRQLHSHYAIWNDRESSRVVNSKGIPTHKVDKK